MKYFITILAVLYFQEIPLKPTNEFEVKLDYQFRQRPYADHNTVDLSDSRRVQRTGGGVLPYLVLNIRMLALEEEKMRVGITNNLDPRPVWRKVSRSTVLELDMGFTDDMIDRVKAHQYTLTFFDGDKKPVDRILIKVEEDGSFVVNGEKRGRF